MSRNKWQKSIPYLVLLVILILIPILVKNLYYLGIVTLMLITILFAVSLWFILRTGQVSMAHAGFAAIGGYVSAALTMSYGFSSWVSLPIAIVTAGIVAAVIGYFTLRIKGVYFIVTTIALGEVIRLIFSMWEHPFGGLGGLMNIPPPDPIAIPGLPVVEFLSKQPLYYLTLVFVLISVLVIHRLTSSLLGLVFRSIMEDDNLAEHVGIDITRHKLMAFIIGSMCASLGGILYVYSIGNILPTSFTVMRSLFYMMCVLVGGVATIAGPLLGATVLTVLSEILRPVRDFEPIIYGLLLIGAMIFFKSGLLGIVQKLWHNLEVAPRLLKSLFRNRL